MAESMAPGQATSDPVALAEMVRDVLLATPGVLDISPGRGFVEATYGGGTIVRGIGVSVREDHIEINAHLVVAQTPIPPLAAHARRAVHGAIRKATVLNARINLFIDDMDVKDVRLTRIST